MSDSSPLDVEPQREERRKSVRQVEQHGGGDDGDEAEVVWNSTGDHERNGPPDRDDASVDDLSALRDEQRCLEDVDQDVVVEHLDANIPVETSSDESGDQGDHIAGSLPAVGTNTCDFGVRSVRWI